MAKTWLEMSNGRRLDAIPFVAWFRSTVDGSEHRFDFTVPNPPIHAGDPNLFSRLSFETIRAHFADWGYQISHIIRGESSETSCRDCYVYQDGSRVPFAVIRPAVFARSER